MNTQLNTRALAASGAITSGPTVGGWIIGMAEGAAVFAVGGALTALFYNRFAKTAT